MVFEIFRVSTYIKGKGVAIPFIKPGGIRRSISHLNLCLAAEIELFDRQK